MPETESNEPFWFAVQILHLYRGIVNYDSKIPNPTSACR